MTRDWHEAQLRWQEQTTYVRRGVSRARIAFGAETHVRETYFASGSCRHCGIALGRLHEPRCDLEQCPFCQGGSMSCDCEYDENDGPS
jgi:hypothetical protein